MKQDFYLPIYNLTLSLADAVDLVSPVLANHHQRVAYIALGIARELKLSASEQSKLILSGLLHDCGAISIKERLDALNFELDQPHRHAELGYRLFRDFAPLAPAAGIIRYHHLPWNENNQPAEQVPFLSHILHLADRISVLITHDEDILSQRQNIYERIAAYSGQMFHPDLVDVFRAIAEKEYFWFDLVSPSPGALLMEQNNPGAEINLRQMLDLARLFGQLVDFRCRFTATHSSGTAACAEILAGLAGFSPRECTMMKLAGYLHDLGKIGVSENLLQKPGSLTAAEKTIIKRHPYDTYRLLSRIPGFEPITSWASLHHETLDGSGYPFHHTADDFPLGARIVGLADVLTALTEDRPYRDGLPSMTVLGILEQNAREKRLDPNLVALAGTHFTELNSIRKQAQQAAIREYEAFWSD